jgi:hypothetical protein
MQKEKTLIIEGQLDAKARRFLVSEVTEAAASSPSGH